MSPVIGEDPHSAGLYELKNLADEADRIGTPSQPHGVMNSARMHEVLDGPHSSF